MQGFRKQRQRGVSILHGYPHRSRGTVQGFRKQRQRGLSILQGTRGIPSGTDFRVRQRERERQKETLAKLFALSFGHPI